MHAASRHGTPSLTSLPKDSGVSSFGLSSGRSPILSSSWHILWYSTEEILQRNALGFFCFSDKENLNME